MTQDEILALRANKIEVVDLYAAHVAHSKQPQTMLWSDDEFELSWFRGEIFRHLAVKSIPFKRAANGLILT